jgi:hypothetical protein
MMLERLFGTIWRKGHVLDLTSVGFPFELLQYGNRIDAGCIQ